MQIFKERTLEAENTRSMWEQQDRAQRRCHPYRESEGQVEARSVEEAVVKTITKSSLGERVYLS